APIGAPRFLLAGRAAAVRRLARGLGRLALPAPTSAVVLPPTGFIPCVAGLRIQRGDWAGRRSRLHRPAQAAAEAVSARLGGPVPTPALIARCVLESLERIVPIDVTAYAGRHFARHRGQTRDMLAGWAAAESSPALHAQIAELDRA